MRSWIIAGALAAVLGAGLATPTTAEAARRNGGQGYGNRGHSQGGYGHGGGYRGHSQGGYGHGGGYRGYSHSYRPHYRSYYRPYYRPYYYAPYYESYYEPYYEPVPYYYGSYCRRPSVRFSFGW